MHATHTRETKRTCLIWQPHTCLIWQAAEFLVRLRRAEKQLELKSAESAAKSAECARLAADFDGTRT